jgi:hypothetical protein
MASHLLGYIEQWGFELSKGVGSVLEHFLSDQLRIVPPTCGPVPRRGITPAIGM